MKVIKPPKTGGCKKSLKPRVMSLLPHLSCLGFHPGEALLIKELICQCNTTWPITSYYFFEFSLHVLPKNIYINTPDSIIACIHGLAEAFMRKLLWRICPWLGLMHKWIRYSGSCLHISLCGGICATLHVCRSIYTKSPRSLVSLKKFPYSSSLFQGRSQEP